MVSFVPSGNRTWSALDRSLEASDANVLKATPLFRPLPLLVSKIFQFYQIHHQFYPIFKYRELWF